MSKCKRVKDPCKICLQTVKPKTGLQCQGACEAWVHYDCLNYTPGKIKDVREGIIHITCPCPDCKTAVPKEYRPDEPYSCNNIMCPANNPPSCDDPSCQANEATRDKPAPVPPPGSLVECGYNCADFKIPTWYTTPPSDPCMEGHPVGIPPSRGVGTTCSNDSLSGKEKKKKKHAKQAGNSDCKPGGANMPSMDTMKEMCATVGQLANQLNHMMMQMRQNDMGQFSVRPTGPVSHKCTSHGTKKKCPQPCYCPGNPCGN